MSTTIHFKAKRDPDVPCCMHVLFTTASEGASSSSDKKHKKKHRKKRRRGDSEKSSERSRGKCRGMMLVDEDDDWRAYAPKRTEDQEWAAAAGGGTTGAKCNQQTKGRTLELTQVNAPPPTQPTKQNRGCTSGVGRQGGGGRDKGKGEESVHMGDGG